jgi:hypothetical protein
MKPLHRISYEQAGRRHMAGQATMLQSAKPGTKDAPIAHAARGYGASTMNTSKRHRALFVTFAIALAVPVAYVLTAVSGWVNWAGGLPIAVSAMFLAWITAIRINERSRSAR